MGIVRAGARALDGRGMRAVGPWDGATGERSGQAFAVPAVTMADKFYDVPVQAGNIWAVRYFGKIVHSKDGGRSFSVQQSGGTNSLFGVSFADPREGWPVGEQGTIIHTGEGADRSMSGGISGKRESRNGT